MDVIVQYISALLLEWGDEIAAVIVLTGLICWWISMNKNTEDNGNGRDAE